MMSTSETGSMTSVIPVIARLIESIIATTPMSVVIDVIICVTPWFRLCPKVSTSLVMRESVSPVELRSKYPTGMRSIFSAMARRSP